MRPSHYVAGIALTLLLVSHSTMYGRPASAQPEPVVRVITTLVDNAAGVQYAQAQGYFTKHGLNVQIQVMNSGEAAAAAVVGGAADIGTANVLSLAIAHEKGIGLELIAPAAVYSSAAETLALVVARSSAIRNARDLIGKTIGVVAINDLTMTSTELWLDKNGGDSKKVRYTEVPTSGMEADVESGTVDAAVISTPRLSVALAQQSVRILGLPDSAVANRFLINGWYAKTDWIAAHRDEARRFAQAVGEAQDWANKNHEASGKILINVSKIDPAMLTVMTRATYGDRFSPALVQPLIDLAARYHLIKAPFPATELYEQLL